MLSNECHMWIIIRQHFQTVGSVVQEYEMQKEFEKQEKLRTLDEEHRKQYEEELKHQTQKHNQHERVHQPGNKAQLEEGLLE